MSARRNLLSAILVTLAPLMLGACESEPARVADAPLYGSALTGEFTLIDENGDSVSNTDFAGQYQLIYFGYTYCPNVCPFDMQRMMRGFDMFAQDNPELAADVQPIFVSVDPDRDTPDKVGEYADAFSDRLIGLTGSAEQVEAAAAAFFFTHQRIDPVIEGGDYDVQHPSIGYLIDREGEPMATIPVDVSPEAVAAELEKWVR